MKIGPQLVLLNPDEGRMVHEKHTTAEALYAKIKHDARERALALDEAISQSAQVLAFAWACFFMGVSQKGISLC